MKKWVLGLFVFLSLYFLVSLFFAPARAGAVEVTPRPWLNKEILDIDVSTQSPVTPEALEVSQEAFIVEEQVGETPLPKKDITAPTEETISELEAVLYEQSLGGLNPTNFLKHAIHRAVELGVAPNTIVLILLLPLVAAIIAAARHLVGIKGFGIFTPAVITVAFVATGIRVGILMFLVILLMATAGRHIFRRLRLQYLPRMALLMWVVCLGVFVLLFLSPAIGLMGLMKISIFPILILILLAETFIEVQIYKSRREAIRMTGETLLMAFFGWVIMNSSLVQRFALLNPEIMFLGVALFDIFLGRFVGLRLLEYWRFRKLIFER
jgi:hypothetical protein